MHLDIALGILAGVIAGNLTGISLGLMIPLGVLFSLIPDIDFIGEKLAPHTQFAHRGILHTPFFHLVIFVVLIIPVPHIAILYLTCTALHLVHDLFVLGRGIMPLYPVSHYRLKLYPDNGADGYLHKKFLWWDEAKTPLYETHTTHSLHNEHWVRVWYGRLNMFMVIELLVTVLALVAAYALI